MCRFAKYACLDLFCKAGVAFVSMLKGKAIYRSSDTWLIMQQTGAEAMPIVSLLNFLVGAILGYMSTISRLKVLYQPNSSGLTIHQDKSVDFKCSAYVTFLVKSS